MAATAHPAQQAASSPTRIARPRLALLGVPLAITGALLAGQVWLVIPLAVCAWWWAPRDSGWYWPIAVGRGVVTTEWAAIGASALAAFPEARTFVSLVWAASPGLLALCAVSTPATSAAKKRTHRRPMRHRHRGVRASGTPAPL